MTKKEYQKPAIDIMVLKSKIQILNGTVTTNIPGLSGGTSGANSASDAWSRGSSDWDDDWGE